MKWEYVLATGRVDAPDDVQQRLNALGHAGWEAIGLTQRTQGTDGFVVLLKRRERPHRPQAPSDSAMR